MGSNSIGQFYIILYFLKTSNKMPILKIFCEIALVGPNYIPLPLFSLTFIVYETLLIIYIFYVMIIDNHCTNRTLHH
jgi:hypothetical protein